MTRKEFENEVFYEAWRHGYNPDNAVQCADDCYYNGSTPEECVLDHIYEIEQKRMERQQEEEQYIQAEYERQQEAEYYRQQEAEYHRQMEAEYEKQMELQRSEDEL